MILQTSPDLDQSICMNGCYFMGILYHASQRTGRSLSARLILGFKDEAIRKGYLRENCFVDDPDGIFALAGLRTIYTNRHEPPTRIAHPNEIEILYYRWKKDGHFVAGASGVVAYDPLGVSKAVECGTLRSKRIFKIV